MTNQLTVSPDESGERMRMRQINDAPIIVAIHGRQCGDPFQTPIGLYTRNAFPIPYICILKMIFFYFLLPVPIYQCISAEHNGAHKFDYSFSTHPGDICKTRVIVFQI